MGHSYAVGSSLQYLCKEYLKAVVHQEFSDIDSDSGTYSDANGIKKASAIATPARQTRGFCKAVACAPFFGWRVPIICCSTSNLVRFVLRACSSRSLIIRVPAVRVFAEIFAEGRGIAGSMGVWG